MESRNTNAAPDPDAAGEPTPNAKESSGGSFDPSLYWAYLDELDLSDVEKRRLLESVWVFMAHCVKLGWGIDPVQQLIPALIWESLRKEYQKAAKKPKEGDHD